MIVPIEFGPHRGDREPDRESVRSECVPAVVVRRQAVAQWLHRDRRAVDHSELSVWLEMLAALVVVVRCVLDESRSKVKDSVAPIMVGDPSVEFRHGLLGPHPCLALAAG